MIWAPLSIPIAFASIDWFIAVRTPESTSTFRSPAWTSSSISSVNITIVANFFTYMND